MDTDTARIIIGDDTLSDDDLEVLLLKAQTMAVNHYYWKHDDIPTDEQIEAFTEKYEFEIYDFAKAMNSDMARDGLTSHTELGISRTWGETGQVSVGKALSSIPRKAYMI